MGLLRHCKHNEGQSAIYPLMLGGSFVIRYYIVVGEIAKINELGGFGSRDYAALDICLDLQPSGF